MSNAGFLSLKDENVNIQLFLYSKMGTALDFIFLVDLII